MRNIVLVLTLLTVSQLLSMESAKPSPIITKAYIDAAASGDIQLMEKILATSFNIEIDTPNEKGVTALFAACQEGREDVVLFLLNREVKASDFYSGFQSKNGKRADPDATVHLIRPDGSKFQTSALHIAAARGHTKIVEILLEAGARFMRTSSNGNRPLHLAARAGHLEIVKLLLARGAFPDLINCAGKTAFEVALSNKKEEVANFLRNKTRSSREPAEDMIDSQILAFYNNAQQKKSTSL